MNLLRLHSPPFVMVVKRCCLLMPHYLLPCALPLSCPGAETMRTPQSAVRDENLGSDFFFKVEQLRASWTPHPPTILQRPRRSYPAELAQFHSEDYVDFLSKITPDKQHEHLQQMQQFNLVWAVWQTTTPAFESAP